MQLPTEAKTDNALLRRVRQLAGVAAALVGVLGVALVGWIGESGLSAREPDITVLYVGADDCAPCRAWQKRDRASFFASPDFPRIHYREVKSHHLVDVLNDDNWPDDLRIYRDRFKPSDGVPLWIVVSDHKVVEQKFGASAWRERILPRIESLLRPPPICVPLV